MQGEVGGLYGLLILSHLQLEACHLGIVCRLCPVEDNGVRNVVESLLVKAYLVLALEFHVIEAV